jgi:hypothetical protein
MQQLLNVIGSIGMSNALYSLFAVFNAALYGNREA